MSENTSKSEVGVLVQTTEAQNAKKIEPGKTFTWWSSQHKENSASHGNCIQLTSTRLHSMDSVCPESGTAAKAMKDKIANQEKFTGKATIYKWRRLSEQIKASIVDRKLAHLTRNAELSKLKGKDVN